MLRFHYKIILLLGALFTLLFPLPLQATSPLTPEEVSQIEEVGTYPVVITYRDEQTGKEVQDVIYVTIFHRRTIVSATAKEAIDAHDIEIERGYFDKLTDLDLIRLTNAKAWSTTDGSTLPVTVLSRTTLDVTLGHHEVTFTTANATTTTVNVIECDELYVQNSQSYYSFSDFPYLVFYGSLSISILIPSAIIMIFAYYNIRNKTTEITRLLYKSDTHSL